jgi:hypothetical protein
MAGLTIFVILALALLGVLVWLLRETPQERRLGEAAPKLALEELFPLHCRYFPQVRQALSPADQAYLRERASPRIRRQARAERRRVTRQFLVGLTEDFSRLERLGRTVAALSPQVSRKREAERLWLGLVFRALYRVVLVRLMLGSVSVPQLARLTELIGSFAAQIEAGMAALEEASITRLRSNLGF